MCRSVAAVAEPALDDHAVEALGGDGHAGVRLGELDHDEAMVAFKAERLGEDRHIATSRAFGRLRRVMGPRSDTSLDLGDVILTKTRSAPGMRDWCVPRTLRAR